MIRRPLAYYFISIFIGCFFSLISVYNYYIGAALAASFIIIIYFYGHERYSLICFIFLLLGCVSFKTYYSTRVPPEACIRITSRSGFNTLGSYAGRRVYLEGKISKIKEGKIIYAKGSFSDSKDYSKGIIGIYDVKEFCEAKDDLISKSYDIKRKLYNSFNSKLGETNSALIMSLCFGDTEYLSKSQKSDFQNLGVIHAVSVSGFHISLIFILVENLLGLAPTIVISIIYVIFTGMQAAAVRALIMIITTRIFKKLYKNYDPISAISFSGIVLLAAKPLYVNDIGFSLSFLATLGIILYYKKISSSLFLLPKKINESISLTLSAQLFTIPYISFTLQNFSFGFLLGNMLLVPLYSVIVIVGNIGLIVFNIKIAFTFICEVLKFIINISSSISEVLLKISPETIFIGYDLGIAALIIFFSYILFIHGYKKLRWLPIFIAFPFIFKWYSFVPEVKYIESQDAQCIYVKYKLKSVLICNYDITQGYELQNILQNNPVYRVITNIKSKTLIRICDNLYIQTLYNNINVLELLYGNRSIVIPVKLKDMNYASENKLSHGIIIPKYKKWYLVSGRLIEIP